MFAIIPPASVPLAHAQAPLLGRERFAPKYGMVNKWLSADAGGVDQPKNIFLNSVRKANIGGPILGNGALPEYRSLDQVATALKSLTPKEKAHLQREAAWQQSLAPWGYEERKDLLQEAFRRVLDGTRGWPVDVEAMTFFCGNKGLIRDIARKLRDKQGPKPKRGPKGEDDLQTDESEAGFDECQDFVVGVLRLFEDDPVAKEIVRGMMGFEPQLKVTEEEHESKRKKIKRRLEKYWNQR
ncbi:hypothetical protein JJB99_32835 [Bradyrhizobium diazoefficiens]|uniref:hypothetical protein n=1 Tax=Bradyrhizobium diazoefficiens TaxID=1355477 RepID=UPI00190B77E0|nr:hypothetical protein [Bradyrhizobium diazoefficiens]QQO14046.1 hypothetical protein JJB99_32835 [Bradyrhizobium diazoefficiens]